MKEYLVALLSVNFTGCAQQRPDVIKLATTLSTAGGEGLSMQYRAGYIGYGVDALSDLSDAKVIAALEAPNVPAIWRILGSDVLDDYVAACRKLDLKRGFAAVGSRSCSNQFICWSTIASSSLLSRG